MRGTFTQIIWTVIRVYAWGEGEMSTHYYNWFLYAMRTMRIYGMSMSTPPANGICQKTDIFSFLRIVYHEIIEQ